MSLLNEFNSVYGLPRSRKIKNNNFATFLCENIEDINEIIDAGYAVGDIMDYLEKKNIDTPESLLVIESAIYYTYEMYKYLKNKEDIVKEQVLKEEILKEEKESDKLERMHTANHIVYPKKQKDGKYFYFIHYSFDNKEFTSIKKAATKAEVLSLLKAKQVKFSKESGYKVFLNVAEIRRAIRDDLKKLGMDNGTDL